MQADMCKAFVVICRSGGQGGGHDIALGQKIVVRLKGRMLFVSDACVNFSRLKHTVGNIEHKAGAHGNPGSLSL